MEGGGGRQFKVLELLVNINFVQSHFNGSAGIGSRIVGRIKLTAYSSGTKNGFQTWKIRNAGIEDGDTVVKGGEGGAE